MAAPLLILISRPDPASVNIRDALLSMGGWEEGETVEAAPVRRRPGFVMVEIGETHIHAERVDERLRKAGLGFRTILVASKHRAESGKPALTVHPIGNPKGAEVGGEPGRLVPTDPVVMGRMLRALSAEARGLKHQVTFEATHHGPYLTTSTMFVEIGTDEQAWSDPDLATRVARAMLAANTPTPGDGAPALVQLGGSHYAPKPTDLARQGRANFGHILPGYALDGLDPAVVLDAIRLTPDCAGYMTDPRGVEKPIEAATHVFGALELGWWREEDL